MTLEELLAEVKKERREWQENQKKLLTVQFEEMKKGAEKVLEALEELEEAKLRNPNLSMKEKQFMKGNREHYVQLTRTFLERTLKDMEQFIGRSTEGDMTEQAAQFREEFNARIGTLRKATQRNFMVLQDFFKNEVSYAARLLAQLEKQTAALGSIIRHHEEEKRKELEERIKALMARLNEEASNKKEIRQLKTREKKLNAELEEEKGKLEEYKAGQEYKEYQRINGDLESIRRELARLKSDVKNRIAAIDKALRKYTHIAMDSRATEELVKDPFKFITKEPEKSAEIISKLANAIKTGQIDVKDKRKEKALKTAQEFNIEKAKSISEKTKELEKKAQELEKKEKESPERKKAEEMQHMIGKLEEEIRRITTRRKRLEEETDEEKTMKEVERIEEQANRVLKTDGKIEIVLE